MPRRIGHTIVPAKHLQYGFAPVERKVQNPVRLSRQKATTFTSRGVVTPPSEAAYANKFWLLDSPGNAFDNDVGDTCYKFGVIPINLRYYLSPGIFQAYENYRVIGCETTFAWSSLPQSGPVLGTLLYSLDKDSDGGISLEETVGRRDGTVVNFDNNRLTYTLTWKPWLVRYDDYTASSQLSIVIPRERWLNCKEYSSHRFGSIRAYVEASGRPNYDNDPIIRIRHRVTVEFKGLIRATPGTPASTVETFDLDAAPPVRDAPLRDEAQRGDLPATASVGGENLL